MEKDQQKQLIQMIKRTGDADSKLLRKPYKQAKTDIIDMNNTFSQLDRDAQKWAIEQVNRRHPVSERSLNLDELLDLYVFNKDGRIINDSQEGQDPEYYNNLLED